MRLLYHILYAARGRILHPSGLPYRQRQLVVTLARGHLVDDVIGPPVNHILGDSDTTRRSGVSAHASQTNTQHTSLCAGRAHSNRAHTGCNDPKPRWSALRCAAGKLNASVAVAHWQSQQSASPLGSAARFRTPTANHHKTQMLSHIYIYMHAKRQHRYRLGTRPDIFHAPHTRTCATRADTRIIKQSQGPGRPGGVCNSHEGDRPLQQRHHQACQTDTQARRCSHTHKSGDHLHCRQLSRGARGCAARRSHGPHHT